VNKAGLCYVLEEDTKRHYVFTFDKIRGYCGQSASHLGLQVGNHVRFSAEGDRVKFVELGGSIGSTTGPDSSSRIRPDRD